MLVVGSVRSHSLSGTSPDIMFLLPPIVPTCEWSGGDETELLHSSEHETYEGKIDYPVRLSVFPHLSQPLGQCVNLRGRRS